MTLRLTESFSPILVEETPSRARRRHSISRFVRLSKTIKSCSSFNEVALRFRLLVQLKILAPKPMTPNTADVPRGDSTPRRNRDSR